MVVEDLGTVLLSGYYGFANIGDEAILASTIEALRHKQPEIEISVLSANPAETASTHSVTAYDRMSLKGVATGIMASDMVVFGGGSLLQDETSFRSLLYYLSIIFASRALQKPVVVYANGIGPLESAVGRLLTKVALRMAKRITVRDPESERLLRRIGVKSAIRVTADPAFLLTPAPRERTMSILQTSGIDTSGKIVWLALRPGKAPIEFYKGFGAAISLLRSEGYQPCFLSMQGTDAEIVPLVNETLQSAGEDPAPAVAKTSPAECLGLLEMGAFCVGMRLHALILSARAAVPFLGVDIDPKIGAFCRATGCPVLASPQVAKTLDLMLNIQRLLSDGERLKTRLEQNLPIFQELAEGNVDMVLAILRNSPQDFDEGSGENPDEGSNLDSDRDPSGNPDQGSIE